MFGRRMVIAVGVLAVIMEAARLGHAQQRGPSAADAFASVAVSFGVPGGVVWDLACSPEARPPIYPTGDTLEESLDSIVKADARYRWIRRGGVINLIPRQGIPPFLRTPVRRFDSKEATNAEWAASLLLRLPEVRRAERALRIDNRLGHISIGLMPGPAQAAGPPKPHQLGIDSRNTTLFGALNSIVRADKQGLWIYREWHCGGRNGFDLSFRH